MIDSVVSALEIALEPELIRAELACKADGRFSEVSIFSIRHADAVHALGIRAHPIAATCDDELYSVVVNVHAINELSVRGFVVWSQPFILNKLPGYSVYEASTSPQTFQSADQLPAFLPCLRSLFVEFENGRQRGHPRRLV